MMSDEIIGKFAPKSVAAPETPLPSLQTKLSKVMAAKIEKKKLAMDKAKKEEIQ